MQSFEKSRGGVERQNVMRHPATHQCDGRPTGLCCCRTCIKPHQAQPCGCAAFSHVLPNKLCRSRNFVLKAVARNPALDFVVVQSSGHHVIIHPHEKTSERPIFRDAHGSIEKDEERQRFTDKDVVRAFRIATNLRCAGHIANIQKKKEGGRRKRKEGRRS